MNLLIITIIYVAFLHSKLIFLLYQYLQVRTRFITISAITKVDMLFTDKRGSFAPILGGPAGNNIVLLYKLRLRLCLSVRFHGTAAGCASGLVLSNAAYKWTQKRLRCLIVWLNHL